jgi:hypothetical protein
MRHVRILNGTLNGSSCKYIILSVLAIALLLAAGINIPMVQTSSAYGGGGNGGGSGGGYDGGNGIHITFGPCHKIAPGRYVC